ncbi:DJ-1/PfpI family protein [Spiroplasma endosymbiont of Notiophilus biguttatus]|uniref:DJ-1/PfpI family protein n=1 Tax=Spiroplasma endosymbiont of Notiophilus biguttatus TaxID=3066285 RepID=UPI00313DE3F8
MSNNEKFKVAIFLATGYEMGEVIITIDLLRRANIIIDLVSIENDLKIKSSHNVFILCEKKINDTDLLSYKMLILPGGKIGVENLSKNELLKSMLVIFAKDSNKFIAAICAAPQILGQLK